MPEIHDEGTMYTLAHVALFCGLTERTIRSHIAKGFLQGEKIGGLWHFTPEQVDAFLCHPAVRPGILAKQNAIVYDFLLDARKPAPQSCLVMDLPGYTNQEIADFFCQSAAQIHSGDFHFAFDGIAKTPRVILRGEAKLIAELSSRFLDGTRKRANP